MLSESMYHYQDGTLVMYQCRRCEYTVCLDTDDDVLRHIAGERIALHEEFHATLNDEPPQGGVDSEGGEPIMEGIERLLKAARKEG